MKKTTGFRLETRIFSSWQGNQVIARRRFLRNKKSRSTSNLLVERLYPIGLAPCRQNIQPGA